jgi:Fur family transcriptional regulator, ferric uptake regulator
MAETLKRNTWQKSAVKQALSEESGFRSAQQLHQVLKTSGPAIGLATVYRALSDLVAVGEADSLQSSDGEMLYRACGEGHHHHLICRNCGKTVEIEAKKLEAWADQVAKEYGFSNSNHVIDIFGNCPSCQKKVAK